MVPGFKHRLFSELKDLIENYGEFEDLKSIKDYLIIPENTFANNCYVWAGASLLGSLNHEIDRFLLTQGDFASNQETIPDRFGEAFLYGHGDEENYFNKPFEESLKI